MKLCSIETKSENSRNNKAYDREIETIHVNLVLNKKEGTRHIPILKLTRNVGVKTCHTGMLHIGIEDHPETICQ